MGLGEIDLGLGDYVGFLPGLAISIIASSALCDRVARALGVRKATAWLLVMSLGVILSATVTPSREALQYGASGALACDLSRVGFAPWREYLAFGETSLNVLLFIPLGGLIGFLPRSRHKTVIVIAAIVLPFAIETTQLLVTPLGRACQSADVFDNLAGLVLGLAAGSVVARLAGRSMAIGGQGGEAGSRLPR